MKPTLERLPADESRFAGVRSLGVGEHIWHHDDRRTKGPKQLTGMVDLTRDGIGRVRARLLDLAPWTSRRPRRPLIERSLHPSTMPFRGPGAASYRGSFFCDVVTET